MNYSAMEFLDTVLVWKNLRVFFVLVCLFVYSSATVQYCTRRVATVQYCSTVQCSTYCIIVQQPGTGTTPSYEIILHLGTVIWIVDNSSYCTPGSKWSVAIDSRIICFLLAYCCQFCFLLHQGGVFQGLTVGRLAIPSFCTRTSTVRPVGAL